MPVIDLTIWQSPGLASSREFRPPSNWGVLMADWHGPTPVREISRKQIQMVTDELRTHGANSAGFARVPSLIGIMALGPMLVISLLFACVLYKSVEFVFQEYCRQRVFNVAAI